MGAWSNSAHPLPSKTLKPSETLVTAHASPDAESDVPPFIRIPHPLECRPLRPRRDPRWMPRGSSPEIDAPRRSRVENWHDPRLEAAIDAGQMRINFNYGGPFGRTAGFSVKSNRAVYHEGPIECAAWVEAETLTSRLDLEFQPLRIVWRRDHGRTRHITLDAGFEMEDHSIVFAEYKGHRDFFDQPDTADLLDEAEEVLVAHGASLRREVGADLVGTLLHRTLKDVFDDRNTVFDRVADVAATALPKQAFRARSATVALLEQEEMREAAGAFGRSAAYDEMLAAAIPTEPSGGLREDEPRAPPQTASARRAHADDDVDASDAASPPLPTDPDYPVADRGAGIEEGDAEGRPVSIWDDDRMDEED